MPVATSISFLLDRVEGLDVFLVALVELLERLGGVLGLGPLGGFLLDAIQQLAQGLEHGAVLDEAGLHVLALALLHDRDVLLGQLILVGEPRLPPRLLELRGAHVGLGGLLEVAQALGLGRRRLFLGLGVTGGEPDHQPDGTYERSHLDAPGGWQTLPRIGGVAKGRVGGAAYVFP
jgi:hypothetical protein